MRLSLGVCLEFSQRGYLIRYSEPGRKSTKPLSRYGESHEQPPAVVSAEKIVDRVRTGL
jgi:hypothetical protein